MKKKQICFLVCLLTVFLMSACRPALRSVRDRYVVVLSMDGFRSDYPARYSAPTLDSLGNVGVHGAFRPSYPSVTFPNHYSMATGLYPDHHGLVNNSFYDASLDSVYTMKSKDPRFYGGEPIWNTAEHQGVRTASFYWVGSEVAVPGGQPSIWKTFDSSVPFDARADSVVAWLQLPEEVRPHLIMWYLEEPDHTGHVCSPDSSATAQMVQTVDSTLHHFFTEVRKLDIFPQIDFIVVADHGMATIQADKVVNLNDYLPRDSFDHVFEGVPALLYPKPGYADKAYDILKTVPNITVWKKDEVPQQYVYGSNPRIGDLIVTPDVGGYVLFRSEPKDVLAGAHGYDNFAPEMEAIFYAAGPSFKQHVQVPAIANVNLYLLIAHLLDIQPAANDGDTLSVNQLLALPMK